MPTEPQTPGTNTNDTGAPATPDSLLTPPPADPATPPADPAAPPADPAAPPADPVGAPEEYADFTVPEGMTLTESIEDLKTFAKEKNLSQEETQKLVDMGTRAVQRTESAFKEHIETAKTQWAESSKTDKEFGGDALSESVAVARKALDTFGSPELSTMLHESGLGNHPEVIRLLYRMGKAVSEDRLVPGTKKPEGAGKSAADTFYDKK